LAGRVTTENLGRGTERMGDSERKGANYLADATTPDALHAAWSEARVAIRHQADVEKGVIRSSALIYPDPAAAATRLEPVTVAIDKRAAARVEEARAAYALHAQRLGTQPAADRPMTAEEKEAASLVVECVATPSFSGCGGAGGRGGRQGGGAPGVPGAPG